MMVDQRDLSSDQALLTLADVAKLLRVSKTSIYRLVERREIPFCRVGRNLRFSRLDIEAFIRSRRVESPASQSCIV